MELLLKESGHLTTQRENNLPYHPALDPYMVRLDHLLIAKHVKQHSTLLRSANASFAGIFVFDGNEAIAYEDVSGKTDNAKPPKAVSVLADDICVSHRETVITYEDGSIVAAHPIWLHYESNKHWHSLAKGCFIISYPANYSDQRAAASMAKLIADLHSESISTAFDYRIQRITRELLENELKLGSDQLTSVINSIGAGLILINQDMKIIWCNTVVKEKLGMDVEGKLCHEALYGESEICDECLVERTFLSGHPHVGSISANVPGQGLRHFKVTTTPVFDENRKVYQVLELVHDITDVRLAESELGRYKKLLDSSNELMSMADENGIIFLANRRFVEELGYQEHEIIGQSGPSLVAPEDKEKTKRLINTAKTVGMATESFSLVRKDGSKIPTQTFCSYDPESKILEVICKDISERLQMEEEIRTRSEKLQQQNQEILAANEQKMRFLRSVSHELRTPLTSIIGFAEILQEDESDPLSESQQKQMSKIVDNAHRLLSMVNDLLDLSKVEAHQMKVDYSSVDLRDLLEQVTSNMQPLALDKRLTLSLVIPDQMPKIVTDPQKLSQILTNLISNAIKFTPAGSVAVKTSRNGKMFSVSVEDTGIGISEEDLPYIFTEFYQASDSSPKQKGTGLGLAIAQKMASLLGGQITVKSTIGEGSTFTLTLPFNPPK